MEAKKLDFFLLECMTYNMMRAEEDYYYCIWGSLTMWAQRKQVMALYLS